MDATATPTPSSGSEPSSTSANSSGQSSGSSSSTGSTPSAPNTPANDNGDADPGSSGKPAEPKWLTEKTKIKRGGQERELAIKEALDMLGDDYEHEIDFGKEKRKAKYADLVRGYQKADGAESLMRQTAEQRKQMAEQIEHGKKNPHWVLENVLGIQDHRQWAADIIRQQIREETQLTQLAQSDPSAYHRAMEERARQAFEQKTSFERSAAEKKAQAEQAAERNRKMQADAQAALKAVGLPANDSTFRMLGQAWQKYQELGHEMPLADLAHEVRDAYVKDTFGWLDQHDDDSLLKLLGDERRKRLREIELRSLSKGKDPKAANDNADDDGTPRTRSAPVRELSEAAFKRKHRL